MVMPMNVKEFDNFFGDHLAIFRPNFVQNYEFHFFVQMLNFAISFVFVQNEFLMSLLFEHNGEIDEISMYINHDTSTSA